MAYESGDDDCPRYDSGRIKVAHQGSSRTPSTAAPPENGGKLQQQPAFKDGSRSCCTRKIDFKSISLRAVK